MSPRPLVAANSNSTGNSLLACWRTLTESAGIVGATLLVYLPALRAGFIWNDSDYVTKPQLQSWHGLWRIWSEVGATEQYYPLLHSAFWLEHRLWGDAPLGYHLVNILLHAAAACLFVAALKRLSVRAAWLAGLIFALHPVCVESVAWIAEQKNTLSTVFYLISALVYLRWRDQGRPVFYWLAAGFYLLALMSKTVTATLPATLLVALWWRQGRLEWKKDIAPLVPWFGVGAFAGIFSAWVERHFIGAEGANYALSTIQRGLVAGREVWFYLGKLFWPTNLIFIYPRWEVTAHQAWQYLFPLGVLVLAAGFWLIRARTRALLGTLLIFVGTLFPTSGFFNIFAFVYSYVADHWQYLASLGVIALTAAALTRAFEHSGRVLRTLAAVLLLAILGMLSWRQCRMYGDMETFYRTTIEKNPGCWMAHNNLGFLLAADGRRSEAVVHYEEAIQLQPDSPKPHYNLANTLSRSGRLSEAIQQYNEALSLRPDYVEAHENLGITLVHIGRVPEAVMHYEKALRLEPDAFGTHYNLANALVREGRLSNALFHYREALRLKPDFPPARDAIERVQAEMLFSPE